MKKLLYPILFLITSLTSASEVKSDLSEKYKQENSSVMSKVLDKCRYEGYWKSQDGFIIGWFMTTVVVGPDNNVWSCEYTKTFKILGPLGVQSKMNFVDGKSMISLWKFEQDWRGDRVLVLYKQTDDGDVIRQRFRYKTRTQ